MKRTIIRSYFILILSFIYTLTLSGQNIYRLIDPINLGRYGKAPEDGPPFLRFGSAQQYYYIAA